MLLGERRRYVLELADHLAQSVAVPAARDQHRIVGGHDDHFFHAKKCHELLVAGDIPAVRRRTTLRQTRAVC
jgi:hypothetical protein